MAAFYTVSLSNDIPKGLIHIYESGNHTLCGKLMNKRWYISDENIPITCKKCKKIRRGKEKSTTHD